MAKNNGIASYFNKAGFFIIIAALLLFTVLVFWIENLATRTRWFDYSTNVTQSMIDYQNKHAQDTAGIIATTIMHVPSGYALFYQQTQLQGYIDILSKQTGHDIVVTDENGIVLADTISANDGKEFTNAPQKEVTKTTLDGHPRFFTEVSNDYPSGIAQNVVAIKTDDGKIVGTVIFSLYSVSH